MFAILVPATLLPLIITLFWAEWKAKKLGILDDILSSVQKPTGLNSIVDKTKVVISQLDVVGLVLLAAGVSLILLPLTLSQTASNGWNNRECTSPD